MASATSTELGFTGERVIPGEVDGDLWAEHVCRYHFAASLAADKIVLDLGCGSGYGAEILAAAARSCIAFDTSVETLVCAASRYSSPKFLVASASSLPLKSQSVGLVVAFEVIEHLRGWEALISEAARVLLSDGLFVVSTPNKQYYGESRRDVGANPFHEHEFELAEFQEALRRSFAFVDVLSQNHQDAVVISSIQQTTNGSAFVPSSNDLLNAHFFVAVCSKRAFGIPSFTYVSSSGNLLRDREYHVHALQKEVAEITKDREKLLVAHRQLGRELDISNTWARQLDDEIERKTAYLNDLEGQALDYRRDIESIRSSFWLRFGRLLDLGPWTEGRWHLKKLGRRLQAMALTRYLRNVLSFALHIPVSMAALLVLVIAGLVFAFEDLYFVSFGKKRLKKERKPCQLAASVIITNWNGRTLLENYLPSVVKALSLNAHNEIIIVDNGSCDDSVAMVRSDFPNVRVLEIGRNLGFAGGSNVGVKAAVNDIVVLLNNDMEVAPDFLAPLLQPFSDPLMFAVSSQIFFLDKTRRREETGLTEVWWESGTIKASHRVDPEIRSAYPCAYPGGGSSAFDRRKYLQLDGFDEAFQPFYYEDTDLGFRAWKRGWKVLYHPASAVYHCHRATINQKYSGTEIQSVINKNTILYCWKNIHDWRLLSQHLVLTSLHAFRRQKHRNELGAPDVLRAFRQISAIAKSRWNALSTAKLSDTETLNQALGGYYRDTFVASECPPAARLAVLFASPYPIEPPVHGGGVFMKQALTQLAKSADVHLISFLDNTHQWQEQLPLKALCKSAHFLVRAGIPRLFFTLTPLPIRQFESRDFSWIMHRTIFLEEIDVVQLEYTMLGQYAGRYRHIPCFLFEHDIFSQTLLRELKQTDITTESILEYVRMRRYEPQMLSRVARVQVCSKENAKYLRRLAPRIQRVDTDVRAAIDTRQYSGGSERRDLGKILFLGAFNHSPNVQGLQWFILRVFDLILAARPDVMLDIVGSTPPSGPNVWTNHPSIRFVGAVPDVRVPLREAGVFVCPVLRGSGVRVKLLEAFASRIPVVSTTIGAEGLTSESKDICELADTPAAFAGSVLRLLEDAAYREELVERASLFVERERDSRSACARLHDTYRNELSQVRPAALARSASA